MEFTEAEERLIEQSRDAYLTQSRQQALNCQVNIVNNDSESGNPDQWLSVKKLNLSKRIKTIKKLRSILRSRTKRTVAKEVANECLLKRKIPNEFLRFLKEFPDIGTDIEGQKMWSGCMETDWRW